VAGRFIDAFRIWRERAEQGDARAAFGLGLLYDLGEGVGQDASAAYGWYRRAADAGYVLAEFNIGVMNDVGVGARRDPAEAALWYARAAAHDYARAEYHLAHLYESGEGVPRNRDMATSWYDAAASQGLSAAERKLASLREERRQPSLAVAVAKPALAPAVPTGAPAASTSRNGEGVEVELCWTAPAESVPVDFFVQVLALDAAGPHRVFAGFSQRSAMLVSLPSSPADYVWRIYTVAASVPDYVSSAWNRFSTR
jgi:TPR repeat protein